MTRPISLKTRITTPEFEQTRDWYRDLLNLTVLEEWDEPDDKGCILGFSGPRGEALLEIYAGAEDADFSALSLQFRVEALEDVSIPNEPRFARRGPEDRPWGSRYLFLTDPNGIMVVIFAGTSL